MADALKCLSGVGLYGQAGNTATVDSCVLATVNVPVILLQVSRFCDTVEVIRGLQPGHDAMFV